MKENTYEVEAVARACRLLRILQNEGDLSLHELAEKAELSRPTAFRLLATLQIHGMLLKNSERKYQLVDRPKSSRKYRIGYAAQSSEFGFSRAVTRGIIDSAAKADFELLVLNNQYSPEIALANADRMLSEKVDLLMEFQTDAQVASIISARVTAHRIPLIAIEIPHPNATYFGANNCQAGLLAGRYLGRWAEQHWKGKVDEVLLIGLPQAGSLPEARLTGSLLGIREILPNLMESTIQALNGNGQYDASREAVRKYLKNCKSKNIVVSAINDPSALGALQAFKDAGRVQNCAVVGQNGSIEARVEMRKPGTRLVGSVGYFPEKYGTQLTALALDILMHRRPIPQAVFIKHEMITPANLTKYYKRESKGSD